MDKRMIAPGLFALLAMGVLAAQAAIFFVFPLPLVAKIVVGSGALAMAGAMAFVLVQRAREIKKEDQDDLSKY